MQSGLGQQGLQQRWIQLLERVCYRRLLIGDSRRGVRPKQDRSRSFRRDMTVESDSSLHTEIDGHRIDLSLMQSEDDAREYLDARGDYAVQDPAAAMARGEQCLLARHEGKLVGACWFVVGGSVWIDYLHYDMPLADSQCYEGMFWVHKDYRGMKVLHALSHGYRKLAVRQLAKQGFAREDVHFCYLVVPENERSLRSIYMRGGRFHEALVRIKLGPWQWVFKRPMHWEPPDAS